MTGIDIVKAQIRIAEGAADRRAGSGVPRQGEIRLNGHALQCRITTEDPEHNFIPDYGRITAYRGATGFGIRLDGGTAYSGAVITRFYDPLLEKVTAWAPTPDEAIARMNRALREFRIRGVATNLTFLENVINHPDLPRRQLHDALHRQDAGAVRVRQAAGTGRPRLLTYIADITVNGHPDTRGRAARPPPKALVVPAPRFDSAAGARHQQRLDREGPEAFADWMRAGEARAGHRHHHARRPPVAARHPHAHPRHGRRRRRPTPRALPQLLSIECWGGATFDVALRFLRKSRGSGSPTSASRCRTS